MRKEIKLPESLVQKLNQIQQEENIGIAQIRQKASQVRGNILLGFLADKDVPQELLENGHVSFEDGVMTLELPKEPVKMTPKKRAPRKRPVKK